MKRVSIDTNVLLRYALQDHATLSPKAKRLIDSNVCDVPLLALAEFGFVLTSFYEVSRADLLRAVRALADVPNLRIENADRLPQALNAVESGIDWFDAMLWMACVPEQELKTFDKKFSNKAVKLGLRPSVDFAA